MAFDGTIMARQGAATTEDLTAPEHVLPDRLPPERLPFVGPRADGQPGYWRMPQLEDGESARLRARTYAAWFLLYQEVNGPEAGRWLMDRIEREMPSRYPNVDRIFLDEVIPRR